MRHPLRAFSSAFLRSSSVVKIFACLAAGIALSSSILHAQDNFTLERNGKTLVLEPYAPNVLRVTMSDTKAAASTAPGYGFIGKPAMAGWSHEADPAGGDVFRSGEMVVHITPDHQPESALPHRMPLDQLNEDLRQQYFGGGHHAGPNFDAISVTTPSGKTLLNMRSWSMNPNKPDSVTVSTKYKNEPGYRVSAIFDSPVGEHYYGLGQQQQGWLDLRDHRIDCWHDYVAPGGQNVCVPFMVSSNGYGIVWDNPSKTTIDLGFNQQNVWTSEVGDRVSFFIIAGDKVDDIYKGYREITGITHMLPRGVYGYIQSKAIYSSQQQIMDVAKGYRDRNLPLDVLVVDFLNMTRQGEMDLDPKRWPDPAAMNDQLHQMGISTLLSVWPHFAPGTRYYDMLKEKGYLINHADGSPDMGGNPNTVGPNIDTTNPEASRFWWESIRDRYIKPFHFDYLWLDETEPDINPYNDFFYVGSGKRFFNIYPLFHTASVYEGFRRDFGDSRRVMILARAAYTGAQRNGTIFWSSDITSTWDMLRRSIPAGLNFTASGMPYWDTDIAGFFSPILPANYHAAHKPLIDPSDVRDNVDRYEDYPELFVRWYEWGAFHPIMRAHGERPHNEVWAYGKQAEPILEKYLKLRYQLLPYTYSLAYGSYQTGAPYTRALFMDFPNDPNVSNIPDEYMYGPAFLVAPVTEQGATERKVYLPAGSDWYNYWTNERVKGGQTITVSAPIDTLPLFVRAGSIIPMGAPVESAQQKDAVTSVRVYPGADADFTLFADDGTTYAYEKGEGAITKLHWNNASHKLEHSGASAWSASDKSVVEVIGR
ncbi:glycoside hydrolase family 31 protein [Silvibacterium acidisoli]|uniref:glycoside hydrolase family 31 protein n=1 Tax=Acidobacteriaceae bacterium ZG23-2 TaxID=2883246 RepID=UPI00406C59DB